MRSVWMVFRAELRRRRSSWGALALLAAVIGGTVLFGVSAAQRTSSAFPEFVAHYGYDAGVVSSNQFAAHIGSLPNVRRISHAYFYANGNVDAGGHFIPSADVSVTSGPTDPAQSIKLISGHWATINEADRHWLFVRTTIRPGRWIHYPRTVRAFESIAQHPARGSRTLQRSPRGLPRRGSSRDDC